MNDNTALFPTLRQYAETSGVPLRKLRRWVRLRADNGLTACGAIVRTPRGLAIEPTAMTRWLNGAGVEQERVRQLIPPAPEVRPMVRMDGALALAVHAAELDAFRDRFADIPRRTLTIVPSKEAR